MSISLAAVFSNVLKTLEANSIDYMIVGSVASIMYGESRMTRDMDLVVEIFPSQVQTFIQLFHSKDFYCPPEEILTQEIINRGQFNLLHLESGLKIDFIVRKNDSHSKEEFSRKQRLPFIDQIDVFVASPEDVIIKKLLYYQEGRSEKHLEDIRGILANWTLETRYLEKWIDGLNLRKEWNRVHSN
jgi:hypothetical protein